MYVIYLCMYMYTYDSHLYHIYMSIHHIFQQQYVRDLFVHVYVHI